MSETIFIQPTEMKTIFQSILEKNGLTKDKAAICAEVFTSNSVDGIYTHGVNRFKPFIESIHEGLVKPDAEPSLAHSAGNLQQWNANLGPGILNALKATDLAIELSQTGGIGCITLANTNHWMRGGYYGWHAAKRGFVLIAWTNTIANMPAWNAKDPRMGNNPLVMAVPFGNEAIVMDMAMSQFAYGAIQLSAMKNENLVVPGGYDSNGELTTDPSAIIASKRTIPAGYWKGAGLALLLDILAAILTGGRSTFEITANGHEHAISQVFIAMDISKLKNYPAIQNTIQQIIDDYKTSLPAEAGKKILYPGERVLNTRKTNLEKGIPVLKDIWEDILRIG